MWLSGSLSLTSYVALFLAYLDQVHHPFGLLAVFQLLHVGQNSFLSVKLALQALSERLPGSILYAAWLILIDVQDWRFWFFDDMAGHRTFYCRGKVDGRGTVRISFTKEHDLPSMLDSPTPKAVLVHLLFPESPCLHLCESDRIPHPERISASQTVRD